MAVCFEKKFLFDPKGNFENVEIEAKNGDLGLENGHGSKRSLFVTEDFAEEDRELQRTLIKKFLFSWKTDKILQGWEIRWHGFRR